MTFFFYLIFQNHYLCKSVRSAGVSNAAFLWLMSCPAVVLSSLLSPGRVAMWPTAVRRSHLELCNDHLSLFCSAGSWGQPWPVTILLLACFSCHTQHWPSCYHGHQELYLWTWCLMRLSWGRSTYWKMIYTN